MTIIFRESNIANYKLLGFGIIATRNTNYLKTPKDARCCAGIFLNKIDALKTDFHFYRFLSHNQIKYLINESLSEIS